MGYISVFGTYWPNGLSSIDQPNSTSQPTSHPVSQPAFTRYYLSKGDTPDIGTLQNYAVFCLISDVIGVEKHLLP